MVGSGERRLDRAGRRLGWSVLVVGLLAPALLLTRGGRPGSPGRAGRPRRSRERVERVVDGDTLVLAGGERVRLVGIDAPEMREGKPGRAGPFPEPGALEAAAALRIMVEGKVVGVERSGTDDYGRTLAAVRLPDGTDAGEELVRRGLAASYRPR